MPNYSGFLSSFTQPYNNSDIMSIFTISNPNPNYYTSGGTQVPYDAGYMYIGNLLIQFTTTTNVPTTSSAGNDIIIKFPIQFNGAPYCVLTSPFSTSQNNYTITVTGSTSLDFTVQTGNHGGSIQYLAIGLKRTL